MHGHRMSGTKRYNNNWQARLSYAYSRGRGNTGSGQADNANSQLGADLNLDNEIGPTSEFGPDTS